MALFRRCVGLLALVGFSLAFQQTSDPTQISGKTYDFIVIGGGLSGLVLANRLTENPKVTVLVIEAGLDGKNDTRINDPVEFVNLPSTELNWNWTTVPQAVGGAVKSLAGGRVLGGSSSINGMEWTRATIAQYDAIEELGNRGWNFNSLFQYMKKSETFLLPDAEKVAHGATFDPSAHGFSGPVKTGFTSPYTDGLTYTSFKTAAHTLFSTLPIIADIDGGSPHGTVSNMWSVDGSKANATRSSSAVSYLYPLGASRPNLSVLIGHQAKRIILTAGSLAKATGVEFGATPSVNNGTSGPTFSANVRLDVLVSAGNYQTPQVLELSGIGDPAILKKAGIKTVVNLPAVGTNVQDQSLTMSAFIAKNTTDSNIFSPLSLVGGIAFPNLQELVGMQNSSAATSKLIATASQNAAAIVKRGGHSSVTGLTKVLTQQANIIAREDTPTTEYGILSIEVTGLPVFLMTTWLLLPQSRGTVHIKSASFVDFPVIDPMYLNDPSGFDLEIQTQSTRLQRTFFNTAPLSNLVSVEVLPGTSAVPTNATTEVWTEFTTNSYIPVWHPIGSCAMMPQADGGVVGSDLIVHGTSNVRVMDASVIPFQLSAHLSSTLYGMAEKAADIIKGQHGL